MAHLPRMVDASKAEREAESIISFKIPVRVKPEEEFSLKGRLLNPRSSTGVGLRDVTLLIQTMKGRGKSSWTTIGSAVTDAEGYFSANMRAPAKKGEYVFRVSTPVDHPLLVGASYQKVIAVGNPNVGGGDFLDKLKKWAPIIALTSLGLAMLGIGLREPEPKKGKKGGVSKHG